MVLLENKCSLSHGINHRWRYYSILVRETWAKLINIFGVSEVQLAASKPDETSSRRVPKKPSIPKTPASRKSKRRMVGGKRTEKAPRRELFSPVEQPRATRVETAAGNGLEPETVTDGSDGENVIPPSATSRRQPSAKTVTSPRAQRPCKIYRPGPVDSPPARDDRLIAEAAVKSPEIPVQGKGPFTPEIFWS